MKGGYVLIMKTLKYPLLFTFAPVKKNEKGNCNKKKTICHEEIINYLPAPLPLPEKNLN